MYYDDKAKVPYAVHGREWISYDDANSLRIKVEYSKKYKLAGVMVWSIDTDDFSGLCHGEDFPLLRSINKALGRGILKNVTTPAPPIGMFTYLT